MLGINTKLSTAFHLQTDGQTERINQELEQYLQMFIDHQQEQWPEWLGMAEYTLELKCHLFKQIMDKTPEWDLSWERRRSTKVQKDLQKE